MDPKRTAKSLALDFAKVSGQGSITRALLRAMKIGFEQPSSDVRYPGGRKAACCISVDYDHFGNISNDPLRFQPGADPNKFSLNRTGTRLLLDLSSKYSIPMTWAICGKTAEEDMASYWKIGEANAGHEIGIHTYSHIDVSSCTESELEHEVKKCIEVVGLEQDPKTFVFPWNRVGHFEKLKQMGFKAYRGKERIIRAPVMERGLWNIPPVYYIDTRSLGAYDVVRKFVDFCVEARCVFHLWTHPWSIVYSENKDLLVENVLDPLFAYLNAKRNAGLLSISTLGEISSVMQNSESIHSADVAVAPVGA